MTMKARSHALAALLVVGLAACSARSVEEEEEPDIEGLCRGHCERVLECALSPSADFDDMDGCMQACTTNERWAPECAETMVAMYECQHQFECPGYQLARAEQCEPENLAYSNCWPEERP